MRVCAVLLAAGKSSRMGAQKALLKWNDSTLLEYQLAQLSAVDDVSCIVVVTGHEPERIAEIVSRCPRAAVAHNAAYRSGKVSSIISGLTAVPQETGAILLLAVDQPRDAAIHRSLLASHLAESACITVPAHDGRRGHPVIFAAALLPELLAIDERSLGIRAVLRRHEHEINVVAMEDRSITLDLNTPEDLERQP